MSELAFVSPLRIVESSLGLGVDFGPVPPRPETLALRGDLHARLRSVVAEVPRALRPEAEEIVSGYSGSPGDLFRAFYPPVWSFLHWAGAGEAARTAHALALFLHLWDDHLCDGQLPTTMLALDLRSRVWGRLRKASREAFLTVGLDPNRAVDRLDRYVAATHRQPEVEDLRGYVARFNEEVAIWTVAPYAVGFASGGIEAAQALETAIIEFSVAWRLVDDLQDAAEDVAAGKRTAIWYLLGEEGRRRWNPGADLPEGTRRQILHEARRHLSGAERAALAGGWLSLAGEMRASAAFSSTPGGTAS